MANLYKNRYHSLVIILYTSGMLPEQIKQKIPRTTLFNWGNFKHEDYEGFEWVKAYVENFEDIKNVYSSQYTIKALKIILKARKGYQCMLAEFTRYKNLLELNAKHIVSSIDDMRIHANVSVLKACKFYGISKDWYYTHRNKVECTLSPIKKCYRQFPNQLTFNEIISIEKIIKLPGNKYKTGTTMYYDAMRKGIISCSLTSFRKYAKALGHSKPEVLSPIRKKGFNASIVFEWLHVDITFVNTKKDGIQKVAFVKDNFSSALLNVRSTSGKAGSAFISGLLRETFEKYRLYDIKVDINILSDGGPENKGEVLSWIKNIKAPPVVRKVTAMSADFPFSNAMSEITHRIYKTEFMRGMISEDEKTHLASLKYFMNYYNYKRYPCRLYGRTPMEVVLGETVDKKLFDTSKKLAKALRIKENRRFNECAAMRLNSLGRCKK